MRKSDTLPARIFVVQTASSLTPPIHRLTGTSDMTAAPEVRPLPETGSAFAWKHFGRLEFEALAALARLDGTLVMQSKAGLFCQLLSVVEARRSSAIEGIDVPPEAVFAADAGIRLDADGKNDAADALNCRLALDLGLQAVGKGGPLELELVRRMHARLLADSGCAGKNPGRWRETRVYVGSGRQQAYVPPAPEAVPQLMDNWLAFVGRADLNPVIRLAAAHAQFELIHPFADGNGRVGRMLLALLAVADGVMLQACPFMSTVLLSRRADYHAALAALSSHGDWDAWMAFFLQAVIDGARDCAGLVGRLALLDDQTRQAFAAAAGGRGAARLADYVFRHPVFTVPHWIAHCGLELPKQTAVDWVARLARAGLIEQVCAGRGRRPAVWRYGQLMELLEA